MVNIKPRINKRIVKMKMMDEISWERNIFRETNLQIYNIIYNIIYNTIHTIMCGVEIESKLSNKIIF